MTEQRGGEEGRHDGGKYLGREADKKKRTSERGNVRGKGKRG